MISLSDSPEDLDSLIEFENSFRKLYSIIKFVNYDKDLKSIVFTSSITSEGKSLLVSTFAIFLSQLGRKVLLIDGDLRKPRLHTLFNLELEKGFSDLLEDDNFDLANTTQTVAHVENLDFISAGLSLTEPTILFSSPRLQLLINSIHESSAYDYILIDTPPSLVCSDASLITRCCSTSLYIISLRSVKKNIAIEAVKSFTESNDKCLGIITNCTKFELNSEDSYSKVYSSYYNNSSLFNSPTTDSAATKTSKMSSLLNDIVNNKRIPSIVRKSIGSSSRLYRKLIKWFVD